MRSRRPIAVLICNFLLLGQFASALHAVEHFSTEIPDSHYVFEHQGHKHQGHKHAGHEQINFSVTSDDDRPGKKHGDLFCLVYHHHGSVQASLPAPIALPLRNSTTVTKAEGFTQVAIEATTRRLAIRGPPVIS